MTEGTVKRTSEIEEPTNFYLIHPMSRALVTRLARWGVSPNAVSVAGLALGAGAAAAYTQYAAWPFVVLGFVLMIGWHVMDGADGQLARLTGTTSEIGKVLDGFCDHGTFTLVYLALAVTLSREMGQWVWFWAVAAGVSHAIQAGTYEAQRHAYDRWAQGKTSARVPTVAEFRATTVGHRGLTLFLDQFYLFYLAVQSRVSGGATALSTRLEAVAAEPGGEARVAEAYRAVNLAGVRRWNLLCSNYRTVAIAVACLAGHPLAYFAFDALVLNAVFAGLLVMQARHDRQLLARLTEARVAVA